MSEAKAGSGTVTRYALLGATCGAVFPIASTLLVLGVAGEPLSIGALLEAQATHPLLWIPDAAPVLLALFAARFGRLQLDAAALRRETAERRLEQGIVYLTGRDVSAEQGLEPFAEAEEAAGAATGVNGGLPADVGHEVRTPMNGIIGMTRLALDTDLTEEQRSLLEAVDESARSLLDVLNDILDFSQIRAGALALRSEPFHLQESLSGSFRALAAKAAEKGVELAYREAADVPPRLTGDAGRLRQVLVNLVDDSVKFTTEGAVIVSVSVDRRVEGRVTLRFTVRDTGVGLVRDLRGAPLAAFPQADSSATRRVGGTGIGLAIAAELVAEMGGKLSAESELGVGGAFSFSADFGVVTEPAAHSERRSLAWARRPVLVVDDALAARAVLSEYVRRLGGRPVAVASVKEALVEARRAQAAESPFELIVVDTGLSRVDVTGLLDSLRDEEAFGRPEAVLMGYAGDAPWERDRRRFLTKPVFPNDLASVAEQGRESCPSERDGQEVAPERGRQPWSVRLLLAEDNKVNQMLAVSLLRKRGYDVTVADTGRQAVELVKEGDFDLVLMDVEMPEMDGLEATSVLREWEVETGRRLPIIALTAHAMERDRQLLLDAGMDDYVSKPIDPETLEATVRRWTGELPVFEPRRALDLAEGDEGVLDSIVRLFLKQTPERLAAIHRALDAADAAGVERTALTLEGAAVRLAMPRLRDIARRIAVLSNRGELERATVLMEELDQAVGNGTSAVRETLEEDFA